MNFEYIGMVRALSCIERALRPPTGFPARREPTALESAISKELNGFAVRILQTIGNRVVFRYNGSWQAEIDSAGNLLPGTVQPYVSGLPACAGRGPFDDDDLRRDAE